MPLDKVFVVIVADVWWGELADGNGAKAFVDKVTTSVQPELAELQTYLAARNEVMARSEMQCWSP